MNHVNIIIKLRHKIIRQVLINNKQYKIYKAYDILFLSIL
jgi:hypothetical protein